MCLPWALNDTENVPWSEDIHAYFDREVKPFAPDAWIDESKTKEGCEIPFTRHFYQYVPPRSLAEIDADLEAVLGTGVDAAAAALALGLVNDGLVVCIVGNGIGAALLGAAVAAAAQALLHLRVSG